MKKANIISVILPVYNGAKYLSDSITSILSQTFKDFELIIVDDGSTDDTISIIKQFNDNRMRLFENENNRGIVFTLNRGIDEAVGKYIVRMDADDIACPDRLKIQHEFMEKNPEIAVCGTFVKRFGSILRGGVLKLPITDDEIKARMLFENSFAHPTVFIRKEVLDRHQLRYNEENSGAEDYGLWVEMMKKSLHFANIPKQLLRYRVSGWSISGNIFFNKEKLQKRYEIIEKIQKKAVAFVSDKIKYDTEAHNHFYRRVFSTEYSSIEKIRNISLWLKKLQEENNSFNVLKKEVFNSVCKDVFYQVCRNSSYLGLALIKELEDFDDYSFMEKTKIFIRYITGFGYVQMFFKRMYFQRKGC